MGGIIFAVAVVFLLVVGMVSIGTGFSYLAVLGAAVGGIMGVAIGVGLLFLITRAIITGANKLHDMFQGKNEAIDHQLGQQLTNKISKDTPEPKEGHELKETSVAGGDDLSIEDENNTEQDKGKDKDDIASPGLLKSKQNTEQD